MYVPTIRIHKLSSNSHPNDACTAALRLLEPHLPQSLPLYRRLQFGQWSSAARLLSSVDFTTEPNVSSTSQPWVLAFVDRDQRPETECWVFSSWETATDVHDSSAQQDALIKALVATMHDLSTSSTDKEVLETQAAAEQAMSEGKDHGGLSRSDYASHMANPNIMLCGSVHSKTVEVMQRTKTLADEFTKTLLVPNHNYILPIATLPPARDLPPHLRWGEVKPEHFALVRSRTQIPRQDRTLAILPSLAIFPSGSDQPISWAFVGLDGSLTTLHVEPEYRGKGLAKAITAKLFREKMGAFKEPHGTPVKVAHSVVIVGNEASSRVAQSLGGRSDWEIYWVRIDLGKAS